MSGGDVGDEEIAHGCRWWFCGSCPAGSRAGLRHASAVPRCTAPRDAFAVELGVDLPRPIDTQVRHVRDFDVLDHFGIPRGTCRRWPGLGRSSCSERSAHRRPAGPRRSARPRASCPLRGGCGGHRWSRRPPRPEPHELLDLAVELRCRENAADVFRTSLARRCSRTSRSSCAIRSASSVVMPGRGPPSISAGRIQPRRVSRCMPS